MALEDQTVRDHAAAFVAALLAGDVDQAAEELSQELRSSLGQVVTMLPMPLTAASVESLERTGSGFRVVLQLAGETEETRLVTRWKDRDGRPVIVEVSHLTDETAAGDEAAGNDEAAGSDEL